MLADVFFQHAIRHRKTLMGWKKPLFLKVETVFAIEITKRPDRLGHDMERAQLWNFASIVQGEIHGERSSGVQEFRSCRSSGVVEWWSGGVVEWWSGGVVEWWSGGVVEWWSGGVME